MVQGGMYQHRSIWDENDPSWKKILGASSMAMQKIFILEMEIPWRTIRSP